MQRSLQEWDGKPVIVSYKPFELDPTIPAEGYDYLDYMRKKFGDRFSPERFYAGPRMMGEKVGLVFNFEDISRRPNSLLAHCLIELTPEEKQAEVVEALYDAFFRDGRDVGDMETLLDLAEACGLERELVREGLANSAVRNLVETQIQTAYQMGISGVPFFVLNNKYAFSGAQPPETILEILNQVVEMPE